jgi:hypothetical protein
LFPSTDSFERLDFEVNRQHTRTHGRERERAQPVCAQQPYGSPKISSTDGNRTEVGPLSKSDLSEAFLLLLKGAFPLRRDFERSVCAAIILGHLPVGNCGSLNSCKCRTIFLAKTWEKRRAAKRDGILDNC